MTQVSPPYTLITGASSGIGRAIALRLSCDRRLILHGRNPERLEETRQQCVGDGHLLWRRDLRDAGGLGGEFAQWIADQQVTIDSFIHCAGMVTILPARNLTHGLAHDILSVNLTSALEILATLVKKRVNQQSLRTVLFISSIWSQFGAKGYSLYCASKGALDAAMRSLAVELAPDIRVNSLLLGAIETEMATLGFSDPVIVANLQRDYPLGVGLPQDAADVAMFLISDKARWITGQQIVVDGGRTVNMSLK